MPATIAWRTRPPSIAKRSYRSITALPRKSPSPLNVSPLPNSVAGLRGLEPADIISTMFIAAHGRKVSGPTKFAEAGKFMMGSRPGQGLGPGSSPFSTTDHCRADPTYAVVVAGRGRKHAQILSGPQRPRPGTPDGGGGRIAQRQSGAHWASRAQGAARIGPERRRLHDPKSAASADGLS